jgi:hypothetical protein
MARRIGLALDKPIEERALISTRIIESNSVPAGHQVLMKGGESVCMCRIGDPIEDADFDSVALNPADFAQLEALGLPKGILP